MAALREPGVAAFLTVLLPGLGHPYAGQLRRALLLFLIGTVPTFVVWLWLMALVPVPVANVLIPPVLALTLLWLLARDAARAARAARERSVPAFSRWYSCVAAWVSTVRDKFEEPWLAARHPEDDQ